MTAIAAVSRKCSTLADGSLRIMVEVSATDARDAFELFGMPDVPMALARIQRQAAIKQAQDETIAADKPKRGLLSQWAAMRCAEPEFQKWLLVYDEEGAKNRIYEKCGISSRSELDSNKIAANKFDELFRLPWIERIKLHHANERQPI